ncbi:negative elongation factor E [Gallus gallus]|uniref:Negative elongation factor E n=1 Tax=Gallus gallus TaxID=9031 RepID=A0A3Q2UGX9_CHICK|nr:negative elongation factor E [Gallus gallus]XP_040547252.1 negative elongation factor E [Gallus gallus]|eukprot:XP_015154253.1 negative elongation factor E [Gallus gallus]
MLTLPPGLTEEEEALQKRFAKLRKKKKALLALKKQQSNTGPSSQGGIKRSMSDQPPVDTATATEQAKLLVKSGAISAIKAETKNSGFKRSRTLEGKLKDPEKGPAPTFQPFQRSVSADDDTPESRRPQRKSLYESFVSASERLREPEAGGGRGDPPERGERDRRLDWEQEPEPEERGGREREASFRRSDSFPERPSPRKGNTLYVHGAELSPELLRSAFSPFGAIIDLSLDSPRNCAFVTYEKMESADQAMAELNGAVVQDVQLRVSIARKQPLLDAATGKSLWGSLAVKNSAKGSHRDKRAQVVYNEDLFGGQ